MKKLFLMLLAIALVGSFAFAEVTGVEAPTLSGEVSTFFGYNLMEEASGFENSSSVDVVVPLAGGSATNAGEGDIYAEITIEDIEISFSTDDEDASYDASISAKIVMGDMYVKLGNPDLNYNYANLDTDPQTDADDTDAEVDFNADVAGDDGISFGYVTEAFSVEVGIASKNDAFSDSDLGAALVPEDDSTSWYDSNETDEIDAEDPVTPNADNEYVFGFNASVTAGPATIPVYFAYDATYTAADALMGLGAAPEALLPFGKLGVKFDYITVGDQMGMEIMPWFGTMLEGIGGIEVGFLYSNYKDVVTPEFVFPASGTYAELQVTYTADLMEELTLVVDAEVTSILNEMTLTVPVVGEVTTETDMEWDVDIEASYDLGAVVPYVETGYGSGEKLPLTIGANFPAMIDYAVVNVEYASDDLLKWADNKGIIKAGVTVSF